MFGKRNMKITVDKTSHHNRRKVETYKYLGIDLHKGGKEDPQINSI